MNKCHTLGHHLVALDNKYIAQVYLGILNVWNVLYTISLLIEIVCR